VRASPLAAVVVAALVAAPAWADHPAGLRSEGWSPLTVALVFGGLALLAGSIVVIVVAILTRRPDAPSE
jgi:ABC-type Fe3+ transport system permease subunit